MRPQALVIGGGAGGFFGAIACAQTNPAVRVTLLEASPKPLGKVKISGGGRCNVTHHCFDPVALSQNYPRGSKALRGVFTRFQPQDTITWFAQHGVKLKTEADGRMFPVTDDSQTIIDCLIETAKQVGVQLRTQAPVQQINQLTDGFRVTLKSGEVLSAQSLLLATGSNPQGYRWAAELGHTVLPPVPSLFTFNLQDPRLLGLEGISLEKVQLTLALSNVEAKGKKPLKLSQTGPLLITHWGLSGPAVLKLSAWGARELQAHQYRAPLTINWLGGMERETAQAELLAYRQTNSRKSVGRVSPFDNVPRRLWERLLEAADLSLETQWAQVTKQSLNALLQELCAGQYTVAGKGKFKEEFVTCGGVDLKDVDFRTLESRCCPRLYFAGEVLDIDGVTGGFNFQSAWSTGWLAGQAMAEALKASPPLPVPQ